MPQTLKEHGLARVGTWTKGEFATVAHLRKTCPFGIAFSLPDKWRERRNVTYAFVVGGTVRYVGETTAGMASRFTGYRYGNPLGRDTDNRVKVAITQALADGQHVEIWAGQPSARFLQPNGAELEIPASKPLEQLLIALLQPAWNAQGINGALEKHEPTASLSSQEEVRKHSASISNHDMMAVALAAHRGQVLTTDEIRTIVRKAFPQFSDGSLLPNDHASGNKSACGCAGTERRLFNKLERNSYLVR